MIEYEFWSIELAADDKSEDDMRGLVDVRFWLRDAKSDVRGVVTVRAYFTDASMTVEQIKAEAPIAARRILARMTEIEKPDVYPPDFERRWK